MTNSAPANRAHDLGAGTPQMEQLAELAAWPDDRRWLRSNFVATIDGSAFGPDGKTGSINTEADHLLFDAFRATCDVVVVGAGTVRTEGYRGVEVSPPWQGFRREQHPHGAANPTLLIVSGSLDLPEELTSANSGPVLVLTGADAQPELVAAVAARGVSVITTAADQVDAATIRQVCEEHHWQRVLCEGGPKLHGLLLAAGAIDEVCLTVSPMIIPAQADPILTGPVAQIDLQLARVDVLDDTVFLRWQRA